MTDDSSAADPGPHTWAFEFSTFAAALAKAASTADALQVIVDAGQTLVGDSDLISVTVRRADGSFDTASASSPAAVHLDALQYRLQEGPSVMASRRAGLGVYECSDVSVDPRLPRWGPAATRLRVRSVLSVGLFAHETPPRIGSLNFMSFTRAGLDFADRDIAVVLAAHAATVLDAHDEARAAALADATVLEALRDRDVIGQAKGILMEREGIGEDRAFEILTSVSQRMNVKLSAIARAIAERRTNL